MSPNGLFTGNVTSYLGQLSDLINDSNLTEIQKDLEDLEKVKALLPGLFKPGRTSGKCRLNTACEMVKTNSESGFKNVICVSVGEGGRVKVIAEKGVDLNQLFNSVNYVDPNAVGKNIGKKLEKKPWFSAIITKKPTNNTENKKYYVVYVLTDQISPGLMLDGMVADYCT